MSLRPVLHALIALIAAAPGSASTVYHVDADAPPAGDGLSWATAFRHPDEAFAVAVPKDSVWLAEGFYVPQTRRDPANPRSASFLVPQAVRLRGGFAGDEDSLAERRGRADRTILSGELGDPLSDADDASHVVWIFHPDGVPPGATRLSHLTIEGARPDPADPAPGGGIYSFNTGLVLIHSLVRDNVGRRGAGLAAQPGGVVLLDCDFVNNHAEEDGGGLWLQAASARVTHCTFADNRAGDAGGALYVNGTGDDPTGRQITNSVFRDNVARRGGGLFFGGGPISQGAGTLRNCTLAYNRAKELGGALRAVTDSTSKARVELMNSIVWGNEAVLDPGLSGRVHARRSDVQDGGWLADGNLSADPLFLDVPARNLRLAADSPCIDAGDVAFLGSDVTDADGDGDSTEVVPVDRDGTRRALDDPDTSDTGVGDPAPDLGAYEY